MQHQETVTRESRAGEEQQQKHALEVARLQVETEAVRLNAMKDILDRLPPELQSVATAQLFHMLMGGTEAIANDARVDGARMLPQAGTGASVESSQEGDGTRSCRGSLPGL